MKQLYQKRSCLAGGFLGTALLIGLVCAPTGSRAYVDDNLIDGGNGIWFVTPAGDVERDADTVQHVVDSAAEGDVVFLRSGIFDFGGTDSSLARSVWVYKGSLTIEGETLDNALGEVEQYLTVIQSGTDPFTIYPSGSHVSIAGIWLEMPPGAGQPYRVNSGTENTGQMINMSVRVALQEACNAIPGFVIEDGKQTVLIRAIGPGLGDKGVEDVMEDPELKVFSGDQVIASNDDWCIGNGAACELAAERAGAFPLPPDSKDAAIVLTTLDPGVYTVVVCGKAGSAGEVLLEVYGVPAK